MKKAILSCVSAVLSFVIFASNLSFSVNVVADESKKITKENNSTSDSLVLSDDYENYLNNNKSYKLSKEQLEIELKTFDAEGADASFKDDKIIWNDGTGRLNFNVNIGETAFYNLKILWKPVNSGVNIKIGVMIDGKYPFQNAESLILSRMWMNASKNPRKDAQGNEYAQEQVEIDEPIETVLKDDIGVITEPYKFALSAGNHTITLVQPNQSVELFSIDLCPPEDVLSYKELSSQYKNADVDAEIIAIQGEDACIKSGNAIIPKANNSDAGMTPIDSYKSKINYIGGTSWQTPGSIIAWDFEVKETGLYSLNIRYKQSDLINGESLRWLKIDGKTPFCEAYEIKFPYGSSWEYYNFSDNDDNPYYFMLEKGKHTISLEVTMGGQSEYFKRLSEIVNILGDEYIKIVMITSESPDMNRDYELFKQIPDFMECLTDCKEKLYSLANDMKKSSVKNNTQATAAMGNMSRVLNSMLKSPYVAQQYVSDYYSNYTSLSSWLYDMTDMPLSIDEIQIVPMGKEFNNKNAGIFKKAKFLATRFLASFFQDYNLSAQTEDENAIRIWVNWGQDQTAILNSLIEDSFTPKTGIKVKLEIVSASLVNGILAGNFPDLSLHMSRTEPVNLGMRGALTDLTEFDDYKQVLTRFQKNSEIPYTYKDALYALPDTQSFYLMFYRTDVFERLGLEVPKTWEDFHFVSTIIQRNNMNVYVPYTQIATSTTVNAGIGSLHLLPTLMGQNNCSFYNEAKDATSLVSKKAINVFDYWTQFYTKYGFLKEADFYNRFRVGVMPLGIAPYSTYMTLYSAAPEIQGRWSIALVPGTVSDDGTVNHTVAGAGTGCCIIKKSAHQNAAWEFLKWWTSADTQYRYTNNVESVLGMIGRTATANTEAFRKLSWESNDLKTLTEQWQMVDEIPEIPGSYYLSRAIDQAFWAVVNGNSNAKDAIVKWSKVADDEIERKIKEYA